MNVLAVRKGPQMLQELFHADPEQAHRSLDVFTGLDTPLRGQVAAAVRSIRG